MNGFHPTTPEANDLRDAPLVMRRLLLDDPFLHQPAPGQPALDRCYDFEKVRMDVARLLAAAGREFIDPTDRLMRHATGSARLGWAALVIGACGTLFSRTLVSPAWIALTGLAGLVAAVALAQGVGGLSRSTLLNHRSREAKQRFFQHLVAERDRAAMQFRSQANGECCAGLHDMALIFTAHIAIGHHLQELGLQRRIEWGFASRTTLFAAACAVCTAAAAVVVQAAPLFAAAGLGGVILVVLLARWASGAAMAKALAFLQLPAGLRPERTDPFCEIEAWLDQALRTIARYQAWGGRFPREDR